MLVTIKYKTALITNKKDLSNYKEKLQKFIKNISSNFSDYFIEITPQQSAVKKREIAFDDLVDCSDCKQKFTGNEVSCSDCSDCSDCKQKFTGNEVSCSDCSDCDYDESEIFNNLLKKQHELTVSNKCKEQKTKNSLQEVTRKKQQETAVIDDVLNEFPKMSLQQTRVSSTVAYPIIAETPTVVSGKQSLQTTTATALPKQRNTNISQQIVKQNVNAEIKQNVNAEIKQNVNAEIKQNVNAEISAAKSTVSSYTLGQIGEKEICNMIRRINLSYEVKQVGFGGHQGDIEVIDYTNNIRYVVEVKLKNVIVKNDVTKFENDIETIKNNEPKLMVKGIFISINSNSIPSIGSLAVNTDRVYLTSAYINEQVLNVVFNMFAVHSTIAKPLRETVKYEIPQNVLALLANLVAEYASIDNEKCMLIEMRKNAEITINNTTLILAQLELKARFIKMINTEFIEVAPEILTNINAKIANPEEEAMRNYIRINGKSKITKRALLNMFPTMAHKINTMKKDDLIAEALKQ